MPDTSRRNLFTLLKKIPGGKGTRGLLFLVIVVGVAGLGVGGYSMTQQISSPFKFDTFTTTNLLANLIPASEDQQNEELKTKDTDGDGLTDYDEINLYSTSPYLADTDSDGLSDSNEVKAGTDPNCPRGEDCKGIRLVTPDTKISDLFPQFSSSDISLKDRTIQEFKKILLDQGYDPQKLAALDDQTLLIILEESLKLQDQASKGATTTPALPASVDLDQVRAFLIGMGVPQDEVYNMSNQELEDLLKAFK